MPFVLLGAPFWLLLTTRRSHARRAGIFIAACLLVILPWTARNWVRSGTVALISTQGLGDVWVYNTLAVNPPLTERQARAALKALNQNNAPTLQAQMLWIERAAQTPLRWLTTKAREAAEVWRDPTSNWAWYGVSLKIWEANSPIEKYLRAWHIFLFGCALVGLVWAPEPPLILLALLYLAAALSIFFITHFMPRFRMGLQPILLPFSAFGIHEGLARLTARKRDRSRTRILLSVALLGLYTLSLVAP